MPFTPTHVLAIVPFAMSRRPRLPFSPLAIGAMIPDLPLFVPFGPGYETTHSVPGLFTACLPLGLAMTILFQKVLAWPLLALLPESIRDRCAAVASKPRSIGTMAASVLLGAATHVIWDAFTHQGRWGTWLIPGLNETVVTIGGIDWPGYKVFQYGSTMVGLPILTLLAWIWFARQPAAPACDSPKLATTQRLAIAIALMAIPVIAAVVVWTMSRSNPYLRLGEAIRAGGLAGGIGVLAYGLVANRWLIPRGAGAASSRQAPTTR